MGKEIGDDADCRNQEDDADDDLKDTQLFLLHSKYQLIGWGKYMHIIWFCKANVTKNGSTS